MTNKISMMAQIVIAVFFGILFGLVLPDVSHTFKLVGDIFLRLMQMVIPLLILGQIIQAISSVEIKELTSLGGKTICVFLISSFFAAVWGIFMAVIFRSGEVSNVKYMESDVLMEAQEISLSETLLNFVPKNIFESLTNGSIIQIIVFALFFGLALNKYMLLNPNSALYDLIIDFNEVILSIIRSIMKVAPIGIFALVSSTISSLGIKIILPLMKYLIVYAVSTFLFLGVWIIYIVIVTRMNPLKLIKNMKNMTAMALATTSSAVTLPVAMEESITRLGLSERITNLVLPLGMSLNSNGSAMHMAITVITISQMYNIEFSLSKMFYIAVASTFISLANAVVPGAGLVSLAIIVPQMGLPIESIAIFAGVEWFVGMLRTILNVNSDVYSAIVVAGTVDEIDYDVFNHKN